MNEAKIATKVSLITVCKGESSVGYRSIVLPKLALRTVNVIARKLDLDQMSVVHTHTERNKCDKTRGHIVILGLGSVDCTGCLRVGTDLK